MIAMMKKSGAIVLRVLASILGEPAEKLADYSGAALLCNHGKSRA
jgi:hypothetical protein